MKAIFNLVYISIFLAFVRRIVEKTRIPFELGIRVERRNPDTDNYYVFVVDSPVYWTDEIGEAHQFIYSACFRCRELGKHLRIVQTDEDLVLKSAESSMISDEMVDALNETIDELE